MNQIEKELCYQQYFSLRKRQLDFDQSKDEIKVESRVPFRKKIKNIWMGEQEDIQTISDHFTDDSRIKKYNFGSTTRDNNYVFDGAVAADQLVEKKRQGVNSQQGNNKMLHAMYRMMTRAILQIIASVVAFVSPYILGGLLIIGFVVIVAAAILSVIP